MLAGVGAWWWTRPREVPGPAPEQLSPTAGLPWFRDATAAAGIDFRHFDGATPQHYIPETMGSGLGWIDADGDGLLDLFCVQGGPILPAQRQGDQPTCKLFRNQGDGTFRDATTAMGLEVSGCGMGCAVGDYDNDGFDDLLVTFLDEIRLFRNEKGKGFLDVTKTAGLEDRDWPTSAAWGDVDGDGFLDLYVCNYCKIDLGNYHPCFNKSIGQNFICPPSVFPTTSHRLYRNNGDGTFADVSQAAGIAAAPGAPGLGVVTVDLDEDGLLDIYVANDMKQAYLFHNRGKMKFEEKAIFSGCGLEGNGRFMAGMGVEAGDLDGSGRPSLLVANYQDEPNMVFRNRGKMFFQQWSYPSGLGMPSRPRLAFGVVLTDFDLDGHLDVAVANGHVVRNSREIFEAPYAQESQVFVGDGGKFRDVSDQAGPFFREKHVARGLAWADYDGDGRPDLAFSVNAGPVVLVRNETPGAGGSVVFELEGRPPASNRNAIGARLEAQVSGRSLVRHLNGGGSYLSANTRRLVVGLGKAEGLDQAAVRWPSGKTERCGPLAAGFYRWREGERPRRIVTFQASARKT